MSWITKLKDKAQDRSISILFGLIGLLALTVWAAVPSEVWRRISENVPKPVLWSLIGLGLIILILATAYLFSLRKQVRFNQSFAFGAYWDKKFNPICPSCKVTHLTQGRKHMVYWVNEPLPKPILECQKCDTYVELFDDNGNELTLSEAKKRLSGGTGAS